MLSPSGLSAAEREELIDGMPDMAAHTSAFEERAAQLERNAVKIKSLEFMKPRIGGVFSGRISGVAKFGLFVQLDPWPIDGLIPVRTLDNDLYEFEEDSFTLRGRRSGRTYRLAQAVQVLVERVDPAARQMDLRLIK